MDGGVERSKQGRGDDQADAGVVGECGSQVLGLGFPNGGQGWVGERVGSGAEVVVALGVAD